MALPHAGIAPGVDRMVMLLAGGDSIREVIPFPMNKNAQDLMMGAPSTVDQKQLDEVHIALVGELENKHCGDVPERADVSAAAFPKKFGNLFPVGAS